MVQKVPDQSQSSPPVGLQPGGGSQTVNPWWQLSLMTAIAEGTHGPVGCRGERPQSLGLGARGAFRGGEIEGGWELISGEGPAHPTALWGAEAEAGDSQEGGHSGGAPGLR